MALLDYKNMKTTFTLAIFCFCSILNAQKLDKKTATQLFEKTIVFLKVSDEVSFTNLWKLDDRSAPYQQVPFNKQDVRSHFEELKVFLDTAINRNFKIDDLEIEKLDELEKTQYSAKYNIKAWFKYDENYYKGFGFNVDFIDNKWVFRFAPDYSILTRKS
jgi:hypothetical protein